MTHADVYGMLLDDFSVVAVDYANENELGSAALATHALLAPRPGDALRSERLDRRIRCLGDGTTVFRDGPSELLAHTSWFATARPFVIHEGYMFDPATEASPALEKLREVLGDRLWVAAPDVWRAWGNKGRFRARCREVLGEHSVPPGVESTATEADEAVEVVERFGIDPAVQTVVKLPGGGGLCNLVLTPAMADTWQDRVRALWAGNEFLQERSDVVVERWLPWESTYSVSFLLAPGRSPVLVAACEQMVDAAGAWVGSRSHGPLDENDLSAMLDHLLPVVDALASDGYIGIAALDVVVGPGTTWPELGFALPSGQRMCVVECNPRLNQHNRIGLVVERLARAWHLATADLSWSLSYVDLPAGTSLSAALAASGDDGSVIPPPPGAGRPARLVFAHRAEKLVELTVSRAG